MNRMRSDCSPLKSMVKPMFLFAVVLMVVVREEEERPL